MDSSLDSDVVSASPVPRLNPTLSQFLPQDALHTLSCKLQNSRGFSRWHCQDQTSTFQTSSHNTQSPSRYGPCLLESPFQGLAPITLGSHRKKLLLHFSTHSSFPITYSSFRPQCKQHHLHEALSSFHNRADHSLPTKLRSLHYIFITLIFFTYIFFS